MDSLMHENRKKDEPQSGHSSDPEDYYRVDKKSSRGIVSLQHPYSG